MSKVAIFDTFLTTVIYLGVFFLIFILGKYTFARFNYNFNLNHQLVEEDNPCVALMLGAYFIGIVFIMKGVIEGPSHGILNDVIDQLIYGILGLLLLNLSQMINDRYILHQFKIYDEIIRDKNLGVASVVAGGFIATGLIIGGAVSGEGGSILTALFYWLLGQLALIFTVKLYELIVPYNIHYHLEEDNIAVGIALSGAFISIGILIGSAISGNFISWKINTLNFIVYFCIGLFLLPITRVIVDKVLLPGVSLTDEIVNQEVPNVGAAFLEGSSYIVAAILIVSCL